MKFVSSKDIMSYGDSKAVFKQRALFMGLTPAVFEKLEAKGFTTMALFAFSCNYSPGASTDKPFLDMIADTLGRDPSALEVSILRRLFSESYANVAADTRCQTEQTHETAARKLAPAERAERLRMQQERLPGLNIKGQYEPGDTLVDKCCAAYESDRIVYIEWSSCISREFELMNNVKKDASLTMTTDGWNLLSPRRSNPRRVLTRFKSGIAWSEEDWPWSKRTFWISRNMMSSSKC